MDLGMAIRQLRTKQDMTQTELAKRVGVNVNTVSSWETGKIFPPKSSIKRVCDALGVPTSFLLLSTVEQEDFPDDKKMLYRVMLEPLRNELQEDVKQ